MLGAFVYCIVGYWLWRAWMHSHWGKLGALIVLGLLVATTKIRHMAFVSGGAEPEEILIKISFTLWNLLIPVCFLSLIYLGLSMLKKGHHMQKEKDQTFD